MRSTAPAIVLLVLGLVVLPSTRAASRPSSDVEYLLKAQFLERITRFVDWPEEALPRDERLVVGTLGDSPLGAHLKDLARRRRFKRRPTVVWNLRSPRQAVQCQVLFIAGGERKRLKEVLRLVQDTPVLTVADSQGFAALGVQVNLYLDDGHLRFEVNMQAVARSGLHLRSKLLRLARFVGPGAAP